MNSFRRIANSDPQNLSFGRGVQDWAINKNKDQKYFLLKKAQARGGAIICKPLARIADVAAHSICGATKFILGMPLKPCRFLAQKIGDTESLTNKSSATYRKEAIKHVGLAVLYLMDCPASMVINAISPEIYTYISPHRLAAHKELKQEKKEALSMQAWTGAEIVDFINKCHEKSVKFIPPNALYNINNDDLLKIDFEKMHLLTEDQLKILVKGDAQDDKKNRSKLEGEFIYNRLRQHLSEFSFLVRRKRCAQGKFSNKTNKWAQEGYGGVAEISDNNLKFYAAEGFRFVPNDHLWLMIPRLKHMTVSQLDRLERGLDEDVENPKPYAPACNRSRIREPEAKKALDIIKKEHRKRRPPPTTASAMVYRFDEGESLEKVKIANLKRMTNLDLEYLAGREDVVNALSYKQLEALIHGTPRIRMYNRDACETPEHIAVLDMLKAQLQAKSGR